MSDWADNIGIIVLIVLVIVYFIGAWAWGDFMWPLTVVLNVLGDFGIGHGTQGGYPWQ